MLTADKTKLSSGQGTNLVATIYKNGVVYKESDPSVDWEVKNANNFASLNSYVTVARNGRTENVLRATYSGYSTNSVTVIASVKLDGTVYSTSANLVINSANAERIVMQIDNNSIVVGTNTITNDVPPIIYHDRTMVPIRVITEMLGGVANWNAVTSTVTLDFPGRTLTMTVGKQIPGFDVAPIIKNDRTYVPVRYISEAIGANVEWLAQSRQVVITK